MNVNGRLERLEQWRREHARTVERLTDAELADVIDPTGRLGRPIPPAALAAIAARDEGDA